MKTTLGCLRKADDDFHLIEPGDHIAIGVSGGKDSLLLLHALSLYRRFSHKDFRLTAFTVAMGLEPFDLSAITALCARLDIPYVVRQTEIGDIIFNRRQEKNPCALCAKMRRGVLTDLCREYGCNKLALGHHRDDAIETLLMSLLFEGRFHTFQPKTYLSRSGITTIRPLCYLPESHVRHMTKVLELPVVKSPCPANGETKRQEMKDLLNELRKRYPDAPERFLHALQADDQYDLWQKSEPPAPSTRRPQDKQPRLRLVPPDDTMLPEIAAYRAEMLEGGSAMDGCGSLADCADPAAWLRASREHLDETALPDGEAPATQYVLQEVGSPRILGMLRVCHRLSDEQAAWNGQISFSVRPSERCRGYAGEMLRMCLPRCRKLRMDRVLIACPKDNEPSCRVVLAQGGVLEGKTVAPDTGALLVRYQIDL